MHYFNFSVFSINGKDRLDRLDYGFHSVCVRPTRWKRSSFTCNCGRGNRLRRLLTCHRIISPSAFVVQNDRFDLFVGILRVEGPIRAGRPVLRRPVVRPVDISMTPLGPALDVSAFGAPTDGEASVKRFRGSGIVSPRAVAEGNGAEIYWKKEDGLFKDARANRNGNGRGWIRGPGCGGEWRGQMSAVVAFNKLVDGRGEWGRRKPSSTLSFPFVFLGRDAVDGDRSLGSPAGDQPRPHVVVVAVDDRPSKTKKDAAAAAEAAAATSSSLRRTHYPDLTLLRCQPPLLPQRKRSISSSSRRWVGA